MDLKDLQKQINQIMNERNNRSIPNFEGYSPFEMHQIINFTFGPDSPIKMQKLSDSDYKKIPLLNQVKYLTDLIDKAGELKLTDKGFLPPKVVLDLYQQGFLKDEFIEKGYSKIRKETDSMTVNLTRILIEMAGLTKKSKGKLSLTKSSKKTLEDNEKLLSQIFLTFATKLNWAYFDGYGDTPIGQMGYGFSLILLAKYGQEKRLDSFYAGKYFKAYPQLLDSIKPTYGTSESYSTTCYSLRTFERFLDYFGLIKIEGERKVLNSITKVVKTDLFDRFIKCTPHKTH